MGSLKQFLYYTIPVYTKPLQVCYKAQSILGVMKIDPYKHEERYKRWMGTKLKGFTPRAESRGSLINLV